MKKVLIFVLSLLVIFNLSSAQVWYHCGRRNIEKLERTNARALRFVYSDKTSSYEALLRRIGSKSTLENRRTQDMLLTVNNIIQGRAPSSFKNLITEKRTAYNLRAMESADSSEIAKDSPKALLLVGVLVGLLGTITLGLIGALIIMTRRRRHSANGPSLLVHDE
ncbi:hypothetical protein ACROYT_G027936 [Oculina patagonica]